VRTIGFLTLLTLALAVTTGLTACGGGSSATPEEELCSALDDFNASVAAVKNLNVGSSSLDDVEEAVGNVVDSAKDVADAAKDVTSANVSELQASAESLSTALADFPSPGSIQAITAGLSTIGEAGQKAIDDLNCDTSS
jgi:hypothetical protein